jgi:hypothetical protein
VSAADPRAVAGPDRRERAGRVAGDRRGRRGRWRPPGGRAARVALLTDRQRGYARRAAAVRRKEQP